MGLPVNALLCQPFKAPGNFTAGIRRLVPLFPLIIFLAACGSMPAPPVSLMTLQPPRVLSFSPTSGSAGTTVTLAGSNFMGTTTVALNGTAATFDVLSNSQITLAVPTGATSGKITVTTPAGTAASSTNFVVETLAGSSNLPKFGHVFLIVEENTNYTSVVGNSSMPYLNSLISKQGLATNYSADTHPSIGNYLALTTGQILTNDDNEIPSSFPVSNDNIVRELIKAGKTWRDYAESLPSVGYLGANSSSYLVRHNPIPYFTDVNCGSAACDAQAQNIVPFSQFPVDLAAGTLPQFSLIVPNGCDDAHNCSLSTADSWLQANIDLLIGSPVFQKDGLLIIAFDENSSTGTVCSLTSTDCGGHVATVIVSPFVKSPGFRSSIFYNHESVLRLIAQGLGLTTFPGRSAKANDMSDFFKTAAESTTTATAGR